MDIALAPLHDNIFNHGKSNIKWLEATRAGACVVASKIGPYSTLSPSVATTVNNTTEDWYKALKQLVDNPSLRKALLQSATTELESKWTLEANWQYYEKMFSRVYKHAKVSGRR